MLDALIAASGASNRQLGTPGGLLSVAKHCIDFSVGNQPVVHQAHRRFSDPLAIALHQHLDARVLGEDVLHALVTVDRR